MKIINIAICIVLCSSNILAQNLISATLLSNKSVAQVSATLNSTGWNTSSMNINSVVSYKIIYNTVDVHGAPTIASGALYIPQGSCNNLPIVSYHHGTEFNRNNVPSNNAYQHVGLLYSGNGYITTMPDYLGMGENPGIHPYMHWESEATASIDLIRAAREYLTTSLLKTDNNQLFLTGYSQGGHSTMATHKYITINGLQSEFNVIASAPLSAPLDLSTSQFGQMVNNGAVYNRSEFVPYIIASYQLVYGNLYNSLDEYYDTPYNTAIENYLSVGTYSNSQWNSAIPNNLYDFMQDDLLNDLLTNVNHPLRIDTEQNNLHNWVAYEPIRLLYCGMDTTVTPQNSILASSTMTTLGSTDVTAIELNSSGNHSTCFIPSTKSALDWFESLRASCSILSSESSEIESKEIIFYPNPVNNILTCNSNQISQIYIYDLQSRLILKSKGNTIDMSNLVRGIYLIKAVGLSSNQVYFKKIQKN